MDSSAHIASVFKQVATIVTSVQTGAFRPKTVVLSKDGASRFTVIDSTKRPANEDVNMTRDDHKVDDQSVKHK